MKKFLKSFRNYSLMLGLSLILLSCTTRVVTGNPRDSSPAGETPATVETPATGGLTGTPSPQPLDVDVKVSFDECSCGGNFQKAIVSLNIKNGIPPFNISGQTPVKERQVIFPVSLGSSFPLEIISSDGLSWKTEKIDASTQSSCQAPTSCSDGGENNNNNGPNCHEVAENVCKQVEVTKKVCVDWAGNSGNCKKWEDQVSLKEVCSVETKIVCQ